MMLVGYVLHRLTNICKPRMIGAAHDLCCLTVLCMQKVIHPILPNHCVYSPRTMWKGQAQRLLSYMHNQQLIR